MAEHTIIRLEERYIKRRPLQEQAWQQLFDMTVMGIREMNEIAKPFLRGFDVLNSLKPIYPEIGKNEIVDTQRLRLLTAGPTFFGYALLYIQNLGEAYALKKMKIDGIDEGIINEFSSAARYAEYLQRSFEKPDTDFELNNLSIITPAQLELEWLKFMSQGEAVVTTHYSRLASKYGYRRKIKRPREGIEIFSLEIGPLENIRNSNGILRVDWNLGAARTEMNAIADKRNKAADSRWGINGIYPTDGMLATMSKDNALIFRISDSRIKFPQIFDATTGNKRDGIQFPDNLSDPHRYLELASRAMMQSVWHNLALELPPSIPHMSWQLLQENYKKYPRQRLAFIDKIVDTFMVDPQMAFQLCSQLGVWQASPLMSKINERQLAQILEKLPNKKEHFENMILDPNNSQSIFEILIKAINEVQPEKKAINTHKDLLVFYEDIFPSSKIGPTLL